jgi:hypothetical protein
MDPGRDGGSPPQLSAITERSTLTSLNDTMPSLPTEGNFWTWDPSSYSKDARTRIPTTQILQIPNLTPTLYATYFLWIAMPSDQDKRDTLDTMRLKKGCSYQTFDHNSRFNSKSSFSMMPDFVAAGSPGVNGWQWYYVKVELSDFNAKDVLALPPTVSAELRIAKASNPAKWSSFKLAVTQVLMPNKEIALPRNSAAATLAHPAAAHGILYAGLAAIVFHALGIL